MQCDASRALYYPGTGCISRFDQRLLYGRSRLRASGLETNDGCSHCLSASGGARWINGTKKPKASTGFPRELGVPPEAVIRRQTGAVGVSDSAQPLDQGFGTAKSRTLLAPGRLVHAIRAFDTDPEVSKQA